MPTDGRTGMTKLIVAVCNFENAPQKQSVLSISYKGCRCEQRFEGWVPSLRLRKQ
jgi:hypothetical protein